MIHEKSVNTFEERKMENAPADESEVNRVINILQNHVIELQAYLETLESRLRLIMPASQMTHSKTDKPVPSGNMCPLSIVLESTIYDLDDATMLVKELLDKMRI